MNRKNSIIAMAAGSCLTAAAVCAADITVSCTLMDIALNHEPPRILSALKSRISRTRKSSAALDRIRLAEEKILAEESEEVRIRSADGTELTGHWFPCPGAKRVILAFHGWRARWSRDFGMIAPFWRREGCSLLLAEQRGQNGSSCRYMGFGLTERFDCLAWAEWAAGRFPDLPVYLSGISMGGTAVLMSADLDLPRQVKGIMADCAFTSPDGIWEHVVRDNLHLPYRPRRRLVDLICRRKTGRGASEFTTPKSLSAAKVPVLLIHGLDDRFVPIGMAYENLKACRTPCRITVIPGAGHGMSYPTDPDSYEQAMRKFWRDFDRA